MVKKINQAVILCGGLGKRLRPITSVIPKPMVKIDEEKPFLLFLLNQLSNQGIKKFLLLTGYKYEIIQKFFKSGDNWGWKIEYSNGPTSWDTGRRVWEARYLLNKNFLLLYSDNYAQISIEQMIKRHNKSNTAITLLLAKKNTGNVKLRDDLTIQYNLKRNKDFNHVELGYMIVNKEKVLRKFQDIKNFPNFNLSYLLKYLSDINEVSAEVLKTNYYSISDKKRLLTMKKFLSYKQIILLDRDGTINEKPEKGTYVTKISEVKFIKNNLTGLKILSKMGFSFVVITNQAGVARKSLSIKKVEQINSYISKYLKNFGINILKFYVCPHHWNMNCFCRKPNPGMFYSFSDEFVVNLSNVLYIGDDIRDCLAAENAGSECIYLGNVKHLKNSKYEHYEEFSDITKTIKLLKNFYENKKIKLSNN